MPTDTRKCPGWLSIGVATYYRLKYLRVIYHRSFLILLLINIACASPSQRAHETQSLLTLEKSTDGTAISVVRADGGPILTQHAEAGVRPYIHPVVAPDGKGVLTEFSPSHHKHQTGLYWGLKHVNGRDYFMNWKEDYWRRISFDALEESGSRVKWQTVYDLLDEEQHAILRETQIWSFEEADEKFIIDLIWRGTAQADVLIKKFYVGGLFVRMPWQPGIRGEVINAVGQRNGEAEGQRAIWADVGIQVPGRDDLGHIAMLDHPDNTGFPVAWRVDNELGVGPSRQILGDWRIPKGEAATFRYRLIMYTGDFDPAEVNRVWKAFVCQ
jgi:hypothetical protein